MNGAPDAGTVFAPATRGPFFRSNGMMSRTLALGFTALVLGANVAGAAPPETALTAADLKPVVEKAYAFLKSRQAEDGSFAARQTRGPGVTALAVACLIRHGYGPDDPVVAKGLKYLEGQIKPD